jgi:hypothetical protein
MDEQEKPSVIDDALAEIGRIAFADPAICTGWVLVSEWFGGGRDHWTLTLGDSENPDWRQLGLLHHAIREWDSDELGKSGPETETS